MIFLTRQNLARVDVSSRRNGGSGGSLSRLLRRKRRNASNNFIQNYADNINLRAARGIFQHEVEWTRDLSALAAIGDQSQLSQHTTQTPIVRQEADLDELSNAPKSWVTTPLLCSS